MIKSAEMIYHRHGKKDFYLLFYMKNRWKLIIKLGYKLQLKIQTKVLSRGLKIFVTVTQTCPKNNVVFNLLLCFTSSTWFRFRTRKFIRQGSNFENRK